MATPSAYAHYKCNDDAANTTVTDDGTGANNGVGNVNTSNYSVSGKINDAFEFNGSSEYITINDLAADVGSDTTGSISLWINGDAMDGVPFSFGDANAEQAIDVQFAGGGKFDVTLRDSGIQWQLRVDDALSTGTWYHLVVSQNGTSPVLYVNGVAVDQTFNNETDKTKWLADITGVDIARIGCYENNSTRGGYFDGIIDDIRYYQNHALTLQDVLNIYQGGTGTEDDPPPFFSTGFPFSQGFIIC